MSKKKHKKPEVINKSLSIEERVGQIGINNQRLEMIITRHSKLEGQNKYTIDVEFLIDGYKVENRQYKDFLLGTIQNKNFKHSRFKDRTGERRQNSQGYWMTITECYGYSDIVVTFEDDGSKKKSDYGNFDKGNIKHPFRFTDSLYYNYPEVARAIAIPKNNITLEDTEHMYCSTTDSFYTKCPNCGRISSRKKSLNQLSYYGIPCEYCSDGISIPEKFFANILYQLKNMCLIDDYENHVRTNILSWAKDYEYDFYVVKDNITYIFETHGGQHYEDNSNWDMTLEDQQENDKNKRELALENGINNYIEINCKYSKFEWLKENIIKEISLHFDLSNIDWELAWKECQKSKCIKAWELWNNKHYNVIEISNILNLNRITITRYLKRGYKLGLCSYTIEKSKKYAGKKRRDKNNPKSKPIICLTTKRLFYSEREAGRYYNIKNCYHISSCCNGKRKSCGKLPDGTPLRWKKVKINHNKILRGKDIEKLHKNND